MRRWRSERKVSGGRPRTHVQIRAGTEACSHFSTVSDTILTLLVSSVPDTVLTDTVLLEPTLRADEALDPGAVKVV